MHRNEQQLSRNHWFPGATPTPITIAQLAAAIEGLPADPVIENSGVWYKTQKEHWLGWIRGYAGPGAYGRKNHERDAKYVYNHLVNPFMLLWLAEAANVSPELVQAAQEAQEAHAGDSLMRQAGAVRRCVPWAQIEAALWGPKCTRNATETSPAPWAERSWTTLWDRPNRRVLLLAGQGPNDGNLVTHDASCSVPGVYDVWRAGGGVVFVEIKLSIHGYPLGFPEQLLNSSLLGPEVFWPSDHLSLIWWHQPMNAVSEQMDS